jgi:hypothetical protein
MNYCDDLLRFLCALLLIISCPIIALAQNFQKIEFRDAENQTALVGVNIYPKDNLRSGYSSGFDGSVELLLSDLDQFSIWEVSYIGYEKMQVESSWLQNNTIISMKPDNKLLQSVEVKAERLVAEEFKLEKLDRLDIYQNPAAKADPILAVNNMPASTTTDESANISLRGSSPLETGILIDNVPIYNAVKFAQLNGIGTFSIFNTAIVEKVNVFAGNPPLEYGNVSSGLIAIETQNSIPSHGSTSIVASMASFGITHTQPLGSKAAITVFSNYQPSGVIKALNNEALSELNNFSSGDLGLHLTIMPTSKLKLKSISYLLDESYNFAFRSPSFTGDFTQNTKRFFNVSSVGLQLSDHHRLSVNTGISRSESLFEFSKFEYVRPRNDHYLSVNHLYSKKRMDIKFGFTYDKQYLQVTGIAPRYGYAMRSKHPADSLDFDRNISISELYFYYKKRFSDRLIIGSGARKSIGDIENRDYLSRQFNLFYKSKKSLELIFGYGRYHRTTINNFTFEPILFRSRQASVDFKWNYDKVETQLSFYYKKTDANNATQQLLGLELFGRTKASSKITAEASLTLLRPVGTIPRANSNLWGESINYFIRGTIEAKLGSGWTTNSNLLIREGGSFAVTNDANYNADLDVYQPINNGMMYQFGTYKNISWGLQKLHPISERLTAIYFFSLNNVFNFKNESSLNYTADYSNSTPSYFSRRLFYAGVSINF